MPTATAAALPAPISYAAPVDRPLRPRRYLLDVPLTGGRATVHAVLRWSALAMIGLTLLAVVTEHHQVCSAWGHCDPEDWGDPHTLLADLGAAPLLGLVLLAALQLAGYRRRMLGALASAIATTIGAVALLGAIGLAHLLSSVRGDDGAMVGALLVTVLALAQVIAEPILTVGMRRALERDEPRFPGARVVTR